MSYYGSWKIDDLLTFSANTHRFDTGAATDADGAPAYRVYEDETSTPILTGTMALLDSSNTAGFYSEQITLSAANGLEKGKSYTIYISAAVNSVTGTMSHNFQMEAEVDANIVSDKTGYSLANGAITAAVIATDAIDADALADGAITAATFAAGAITATVIATDAIDADAIADNAIDAGAIAADAITAAKIADGAIDAATFAAGAITAAAIATDAIDNDAIAANAVTEIQSGLATAASIAALNNLSAAQVNSEVDTALADIRLDELLAADSDIDGVAPPTVGSVFHELMSKTTGSFTFDQTTDSNEALRDRGDAAWITATGFSTLSQADVRTAVGLGSANLDTQLAALPTAGENADAVWEEAIADHSGTAGSTAEALNAAGAAGDPWTTALPGAYGAGSAGNIIGNNLNATVSSRATQTSVDTLAGYVDTEVAAILADTNELQTDWTNGGRLDLILDSIDSDAAAILADTGTDGVVVAAGSKTGYSLSAAGIQAIWDALTSALTTAGSIGKLIVDNLNATISSRSSHSAADVWSVATRILTAGTNIVLAKGVGVTGFNDLSAAQVNTEADTALSDYDPPTHAELVSEINSVQSDISGLNNLSAAQVNAEVVDVMRTDTLPDSYAADGAQPTIAQALLAIHQFLTEKEVSGTTVSVKKPDGTTSVMTFTLDDATTPTSITRAT
jgi:hypothetical protein